MAFTVSDPEQLRAALDDWPQIRPELESARAAAGLDTTALLALLPPGVPMPRDRVGWARLGRVPGLLRAHHQDAAWDRVSAYRDGITRVYVLDSGMTDQDCLGPWPEIPDERPPTAEQVRALERDTDESPGWEWQARNAALPWVGLWVTAGKSAGHWNKDHRARSRDWATHRDAIAGRAIDTWNSWAMVWADQMQDWAAHVLPQLHTQERPLPSWR